MLNKSIQNTSLFQNLRLLIVHVSKPIPDGYLETEFGRRHSKDSLPNEINEICLQPHKSLDICQLRE